MKVAKNNSRMKLNFQEYLRKKRMDRMTHKERNKKCVIFMCYSSEELITPFTSLSPPGTHFTAESTEAMRIRCLAQGHNGTMEKGGGIEVHTMSWLMVRVNIILVG